MTIATDLAADPFLDGLQSGLLRATWCRDCGSGQSLVSLVCRRCGSLDTFWAEVSGPGTIHSLTEIHRAPTPAFRDLVPYVLALVDFDGGARIMGQGGPGLNIGDRVGVEFSDHDHENIPLIRFVKMETL